MDARAALLWNQPGAWEICDVQLDHPGNGEVLVEMVATGLCHSDDHIARGDIPITNFPFCGGHEGSGIVREVGPGVSDLHEGDHIVTSFVPACGRCRWCASGMQNLCDNGASILTGSQIDGTYRMHYRSHDVATGAMLGTFANWQIFDRLSCTVIRPDVPLDVACLVACGVPTGWGSATIAANVQVGDVTVVMGIGGVGINAVQGAYHAGAGHIIAVDPVPFKREMALEFGATEAFAHISAAAEFSRSISNGQGADSAIVTVGVLQGEHIAGAFAAIRKGGTVVVTSQAALAEVGIPISLFELSMYQKRIQGVLYGMSSPWKQIPMLLDLYVAGTLKLDELVTTRYPLHKINEAYDDMRNGINIRGVIEFDH